MLFLGKNKLFLSLPHTLLFYLPYVCVGDLVFMNYYMGGARWRGGAQTLFLPCLLIYRFFVCLIHLLSLYFLLVHAEQTVGLFDPIRCIMAVRVSWVGKPNRVECHMDLSAGSYVCLHFIRSILLGFRVSLCMRSWWMDGWDMMIENPSYL